MVRPLEDTHQPDGTPIFMATTATPIILATTATTLSTPPCLATGTITKLARRGAVLTRSQLAKRCTLYLARRTFPSSLAQQLRQLGDVRLIASAGSGDVASHSVARTASN